MASPALQILLHPVSGPTRVLRDLRTVGDLHAAALQAHPHLASSPSDAAPAPRPSAAPAASDDDAGSSADERASVLMLSTGARLLDLSPGAADTPLAALGVADCASVFASARLLGGGKKRKKKTYTKPKKIKHKHKTVKLGVLRYYKVGADGEVERLRKECPEEPCGAGIFFAKHADRFYCGKCGLTLVEKA